MPWNCILTDQPAGAGQIDHLTLALLASTYGWQYVLPGFLLKFIHKDNAALVTSLSGHRAFNPPGVGGRASQVWQGRSRWLLSLTSNMRLALWRSEQRPSGLFSRMGCAPPICAAGPKPWGRCAALSRHKAAPTHIHTHIPKASSRSKRLSHPIKRFSTPRRRYFQVFRIWR